MITIKTFALVDLHDTIEHLKEEYPSLKGREFYIAISASLLEEFRRSIPFVGTDGAIKDTLPLVYLGYRLVYDARFKGRTLGIVATDGTNARILHVQSDPFN